MAMSDETQASVLIADVPTTTKDMTSMMEWELGDADPKGTQAEAHVGMRQYRSDLRNPPTYGDFYVDTLTSKKSLAQQLKER